MFKSGKFTKACPPIDAPAEAVRDWLSSWFEYHLPSHLKTSGSDLQAVPEIMKTCYASGESNSHIHLLDETKTKELFIRWGISDIAAAQILEDIKTAVNARDITSMTEPEAASILAKADTLLTKVNYSYYLDHAPRIKPEFIKDFRKAVPDATASAVVVGDWISTWFMYYETILDKDILGCINQWPFDGHFLRGWCRNHLRLHITSHFGDSLTESQAKDLAYDISGALGITGYMGLKRNCYECDEEAKETRARRDKERYTNWSSR